MNKTPLLYTLGRIILGPIFRLYYNPKVFNKEYLKQEGPVIIAGNHIHVYDQFLTIIDTKRFIRYMAKKEYFDSIKTAWFFKRTGCISVDRKIKDEEATKEALKTLENGLAIGIFPEGTRNKTEEFLLPFKYGTVSLAKKTDSYIIPLGITGTYKFRSKDLTIRYGKPFKVTDMEIEEANDKLYNEVKKLMEENLKEK